MYKVYAFYSIKEYERFLKGTCYLSRYKIVSVNTRGDDIFVTVYKEELSGY